MVNTEILLIAIRFHAAGGRLSRVGDWAIVLGMSRVSASRDVRGFDGIENCASVLVCGPLANVARDEDGTLLYDRDSFEKN
jgi:hypothetical protein